LLLLSGCDRPLLAPPSAPAAAGPAAALFADVAERAGVHFRHNNGAEGQFRFLETLPAGCALFDYDNDGLLDLFLPQSGPSGSPGTRGKRTIAASTPALYHNAGNGRFVEVTPGSGLDRDLGYAHGVAVGDYDNDGFRDLFLTAYGGNRLFRNERGSGRFTDVTAAAGLEGVHGAGYATSAAFGDYDNDGRLDLYVCYYARWTWANDRACFARPRHRDYCRPDLYAPETHRLFRNEAAAGALRFRDVSEEAGISGSDTHSVDAGRGLAVAFLDFDRDGWQDLFVANDLTPNMLWRNRGGEGAPGAFKNVAVQAGCAYSESGGLMAAMGIAVADYDCSGRESLFVTNYSGLPNTLFRNAGGRFQDASMEAGLALPHLPFLAFGCEFLDYDNDGWPDLLVANGHVQAHPEADREGVTTRERKQLFRNRGDRRFEEITSPVALGDLALPRVSRGLAVGDWDNDGRVDALVSNQNDAVQLFRNLDRSGHHWIAFRTVGTRSNRDGLHARFALTAGGATQSATVRAGSSYLSASDPRLHFGLGSVGHVQRVEIRWPSGTIDTLADLAADAIYTVTEGHGVTGRWRAAHGSGELR
jgi:hypothetical protein